MSVVRDPQTGQFRRSDDLDGHDLAVMVGSLQITLNSADLTTGNDTVTVDGEESVIIDFNDKLDNDEIFVAHRAEVIAQLQAGRTATAEHVYNVSYALTRDIIDLSTVSALFLLNNETVGIANIARTDLEDSSVLLKGVVSGAGDLADSATGLAGGSDANQAHQVINFPGAALPAPTFDEQDELCVPADIQAEGSDDQSFSVQFDATLHGVVHER